MLSIQFFIQCFTSPRLATTQVFSLPSYLAHSRIVYEIDLRFIQEYFYESERLGRNLNTALV